MLETCKDGSLHQGNSALLRGIGRAGVRTLLPVWGFAWSTPGFRAAGTGDPPRGKGIKCSKMRSVPGEMWQDLDDDITCLSRLRCSANESDLEALEMYLRAFLCVSQGITALISLVLCQQLSHSAVQHGQKCPTSALHVCPAQRCLCHTSGLLSRAFARLCGLLSSWLLEISAQPLLFWRASEM